MHHSTTWYALVSVVAVCLILVGVQFYVELRGYWTMRRVMANAKRRARVERDLDVEISDFFRDVHTLPEPGLGVDHVVNEHGPQWAPGGGNAAQRRKWRRSATRYGSLENRGEGDRAN